MIKKTILALSAMFIPWATPTVALAAEAAPLPGTPGSAVPASATPSTSVPSTAPSATPFPTLSAPAPSGSPMQTLIAPDISKNAFVPSDSTSSIDAFFQKPKQPVLPSINGQLPAKAPSDAGNSQAGKEEHKGFRLGRFLYHVLDNAGVPVPVKKDDALDPSIAAPSTQLSVDVKRLERIVPPGEATASGQARLPNQKIPESELEGVELPVPKDVPNTK
jgi:hypothetical protein